MSSRVELFYTETPLSSSVEPSRPCHCHSVHLQSYDKPSSTVFSWEQTLRLKYFCCWLVCLSAISWPQPQRCDGQVYNKTKAFCSDTKNMRQLDAKNLHCLDHTCTFSKYKREGASSSEFWSGRPNGAIWWQLKAVFSLSSTSLWPAARFFFTTSKKSNQICVLWTSLQVSAVQWRRLIARYQEMGSRTDPLANPRSRPSRTNPSCGVTRRQWPAGRSSN